MTKKLLLADDSVTVQRVIELTFADEGMQVIAVGDGRQAIERIEADSPDIVLADVSMPELDGYAVAAHVKNASQLSHIPVVLMTGAFEQIDEARAAEVGCDGVLAKPFEPHMVIALVRQLLGEPTGVQVGSGEEAANGAADGYPFEPDAGSEETTSLDEYLDRLDEALAEAPAPQPRPEPTSTRQTVGETAADLPADSVDDTALADAFSVLLADELGERPLTRPVTSPSSAIAGSALSDAQLDDLARRVAERLTPAAVEAAVSRHVLDIAERLVRDEIARLKAQA